MTAASRIPTSAQSGVHEHLARLVERHRARPFAKPYAPYNLEAFAGFGARYAERMPDAPLILDAGCGVGDSTISLGRAYPGHYVVGVDQSVSRLARNTGAKRDGLPANVDLVRADLVDFWRLLHDAGLRLDQHYLLYPNPWPKIGHVGRRWPGHPVFPTLIALGGILECRSNWPIYVDEFCLAVERLTGNAPERECFIPEPILTPFERKYLASGHTLFRARIALTGSPSAVD